MKPICHIFVVLATSPVWLALVPNAWTQESNDIQEAQIQAAQAPDEERAKSDQTSDESQGIESVQSEFSHAQAVAFVRQYCLDCHSAEQPEADLNLESFQAVSDIGGQIGTWNKVLQRVGDFQMPPMESLQPDRLQRKEFLDWVRSAMQESLCGGPISPGPPRMRRLSRFEYSNTLHDLLGIAVDTSQVLPEDGAGGEGFDNASETLFISSIHAEKYMESAKAALDYAMNDPPTRQGLLIAEPTESVSPSAAAEQVLDRFLPLAFRRAITQDERQSYQDLFAAARQQQPEYSLAIRYPLEAALVSPKFLFLWEEPCQSDQPELISQYEMASRLSYFLWATMPDKTLLELAAEGKLHEPEVLRQQVARMLHSHLTDDGLRPNSRVRAFATIFIEQWLGTRSLGREIIPDPSVIRRFDSELVGGLKYEPILFFEDLLSENGSVLQLLDADFTYLNRRLASHYKIKGEFTAQPKRVSLSEHDHRGGLLGMGAVLTVSSLPHRTSPVIRGKWILEAILGTPPPPPPPGVPELEKSVADRPQTLREQLEQHRASAACSSCHSMMDPLGFGLENFDVTGRWREEIDDVAIDSRGEMADGTQFTGHQELKKVLLERKGLFLRHLTAKMLGFALSRQLTDQDQCTVMEIVKRLEQDDYRMQTLVYEIVNSRSFRYKMNVLSVPQG